MQSNDILNIPRTTEVVVIDIQQDNRGKREADIGSVEPSRVKYGYRVDGIRYSIRTKTNRYFSENIDDFVQTAERTYGFLVKFDAGNDNYYYAVVKPVNFVGTRVEYDAIWQPKLAQRAEENRIAQEQRAIQIARNNRKEAIRKVREVQLAIESDRIKEVTLENIEAVLGMRAKIFAEVKVGNYGTWDETDPDNPIYIVEQKGTVSLALRDFQRLLEKAIQD